MRETSRRRSLLLGLGIAGALLFTGIGCGSDDDAPHGETRFNIIWVVLDAAGASHFGLYGYDRDTTPNIDRLAAESAVFDRAYAQYPSTLFSTGSFLTGFYPHEAMTDNKLSAPPIGSRLQALGFRTVGFSENPWVSTTFGFEAGFDEFHSIEPAEAGGSDRRDTTGTIKQALAWIRANAAQPFLLYLHLLPPHSPYDPPPPFRGKFRTPEQAPKWPPLEATLGQRAATKAEMRLVSQLASGKLDLRSLEVTKPDIELIRAAYDENLSFVDHQVGRLLDAIRDLDLLERSIVILTSDHGEAFAEHDQLFHASSLYAEQIHVPLLIRLPGSLGASPGRWQSVVELIDIVPTLLDVLDVELPALAGQSLLPLIESRGESDGLARAWLDRQGLASVQRNGTKLITGGAEPLLFDLRSDAAELENLAGREPRLLEALLSYVDTPDPTDPSEPGIEVDSKTKAQLEALGYAIDVPSEPRETPD